MSTNLSDGSRSHCGADRISGDSNGFVSIYATVLFWSFISGERRVGVVVFDVTANESGEGPAVSGVVGGLATSEFGDADAELTVNDGEKDYTVDPRVRYHDGGSTAMAETNVELLGTRLGVVMDCDGEECQPGTRGLPQFKKPPAIPAPTGE